MRPIFKAILPKIGIVRTIALEYRYGPMMMQVMSMLNIYTMQGIEHIQFALSHRDQMLPNQEREKCMKKNKFKKPIK